MGQLTGEVTLVTGAGGGIGSAVARLFAAEGAAVVVADVAEAAARRLRLRLSAPVARRSPFNLT